MERWLRTGGKQIGRQRRRPKRRDPLREGSTKDPVLRHFRCGIAAQDSSYFRNIINDFSQQQTCCAHTTSGAPK